MSRVNILKDDTKDMDFKLQRTHSAGFTLVELVVTTAVIGILAVLSVQHFVTYRAKAYDMQALTYLRNAVTAREAGKDAWEPHQAQCRSLSVTERGGLNVPGACPLAVEQLLPGLKLPDPSRLELYVAFPSDIVNNVIQTCHRSGTTESQGFYFTTYEKNRNFVYSLTSQKIRTRIRTQDSLCSTFGG